jgi:hypothetical protein
MKSAAAIATSEQYADIARIIQGRPAVSLSRLPAVWRALAKDEAFAPYVEAAQLFAYHGTPMANEALNAIGGDFEISQYPDLRLAKMVATTTLAQNTVKAVEQLFAEFGHTVPASFYNVILATSLREDTDKLLGMFKDKDVLMRDRLWDAVLHAMLLITPIGLRVQSVLSQHGVRFTHVMNCGCITAENPDASFDIKLDADLKAAYLQNMMAAAFEQYGVNAATSRAGRGF